MTKYIKLKIHWKNCINNQYMNSSRNHTDYDISKHAISEVPELVDNAKNNYYMLANKLPNPSTCSNTEKVYSHKKLLSSSLVCF